MSPVWKGPDSSRAFFPSSIKQQLSSGVQSVNLGPGGGTLSEFEWIVVVALALIVVMLGALGTTVDQRLREIVTLLSR